MTVHAHTTPCHAMPSSYVDSESFTQTHSYTQAVTQETEQFCWGGEQEQRQWLYICLVFLHMCVCVCAHVCAVCVWDKDRLWFLPFSIKLVKQKDWPTSFLLHFHPYPVCAWARVCVCVWACESESERDWSHGRRQIRNSLRLTRLHAWAVVVCNNVCTGMAGLINVTCRMKHMWYACSCDLVNTIITRSACAPLLHFPLLLSGQKRTLRY